MKNRSSSSKGINLKCFDKDFITELFLDSDSVSTMNRLVVAIANVVHENNENLITYNEAYNKQYSEVVNEQQSKSIQPVPRKLIGCYEDFDVFHNYDDKEFIKRFKMKKSTVEALLNFLKDKDTSLTPNIPLDKKLHIFLWLLTTNCSYREVGLIFRLTKSSVSYVFHEMAALLADQRHNFISWPFAEEQHLTRIKVNSRFKFPNCVGFIDTCRFNVGSKRRKKQNLKVIMLQGVCDESLMFIDIHIGPLGETKKYKVYKDSSLSDELKNFVDFENHILGDSEYKLKKNLITPFSSQELLTSEEMKFNEVHWKARSYIGHAFVMLKERFKKLNHIDVNKVDDVSKIICAACVLHNFILLHEGSNEIKEELIVCEDGVTIDTNIVKTSTEKRQFLCNYINYIDLDNSELSAGLLDG